MNRPSIPFDEEKRLESLKNLHILDTPAEERFDRITRLARQIFQVPVALVTLVDTHRQWFKSCQGLLLGETSRDISFCAYAILQDSPLIIPDARQDERFTRNPLVTGEPYIRFYAGIPLHAPDQSKLGTLCIIDFVPRELSLDELDTLKDLAIWAENEIHSARLNPVQESMILEMEESRIRSRVDPLTRAWNREGIMALFERSLELAGKEKRPVAVLMGDLNNLKEINDTYGHSAGDKSLRETADRIRKNLSDQDSLGRLGGDEFLMILGNLSQAEAERMKEKIRDSVSRDYPAGPNIMIPLAMSFGLAFWKPVPGGKASGKSLSELATHLVKTAEQVLYEDKKMKSKK